MTNRELVSRYYEMWNDQSFESAAAALLHPDVRFHGSLGITANGLEGFKEYAQLIIGAIPNLYHAVEISVFEDERAAIYVTYTGTHRGRLLDFEPKGNRICYSGASFFHFRDGKIYDIKVLGDLNTLFRQLG